MSQREGQGDRVADAFARFAASLDYSMVVVTAAADGQRSGCLVGFWTQVSIDPGRFLVCVSPANHTADVAESADHLGVHRLSTRHLGLARLFGEQTGDETDKFADCAWHEGAFGVPILDDCESWFVGRTIEKLDFGDHRGFVLTPVAAAADDHQKPLTMAELPDLHPGHPA